MQVVSGEWWVVGYENNLDTTHNNVDTTDDLETPHNVDIAGDLDTVDDNVINAIDDVNARSITLFDL